MSILRVCSETDDLGGGRYRHVQHLRPIAYLRDGAMRRMTWGVGTSGDVDMSLGIDEAMLVRFAPRIAGKSSLWEIRAPDRSKMARFALLNANNVSAQRVDANEYVYPNALNGTDLALIYAGHKVSADLRLRAGHPRIISWRMDAQVGFDPARMMLGDMTLRQPVLLPLAEDIKSASIPLKWTVAQEKGRYTLTCALPKGNWAGWTLDPTLTLQPDAAAGQDTYTQDNDPNKNNASATTMVLYDQGDLHTYGLLKFGLSSIPSGATVTSAMLSMFLNKNIPVIRSTWVYSILAANSSWTEAGATWNYAVASVTRWAGDTGGDGGADAGCSVAGTDFNALRLGTLTAPANTPVGTEIQAVLEVSQVQSWLAANYGMRLQCQTGVGDQIWFSSDHATAAYRPKLVIEYTLPGSGGIFQSAIMHSSIYGKTLVR